MADAIHIEAGVPLPPRNYNRPSSAKNNNPIRQMAVGDSFFYPTTEFGQPSVNKLYARIKAVHGKGSAAIRRVEGGYRAWRIA